MRAYLLLLPLIFVIVLAGCDQHGSELAARNGEPTQTQKNESVEALFELATQGDMESQLEVGLMYYEGEGVDKNYEEAAKWLMKAAEQGDPEAQYRVGVLYNRGKGIKQDYKESLIWLKKSAEQGNAKAQYSIGATYIQNDINQNYAEAAKWFAKSAEQGVPEAQYNLGVAYYNGNGIDQNYAEAAKWFAESAEQGVPEAQYNLGSMYILGEGITQNHAEAIKWYTKAAEQGFAEAQYTIGSMYDLGTIIDQNHAEAVKWYIKAAEKGHSGAQNNIGVAYNVGDGVTQSYTEALRWYTRAAEQGNTDAQNNIGSLYSEGKGVTQSYTEAVKWYMAAAKQGNADAQNNIGIAYHKGEGVTQNYAEGVKWYVKAVEQGHAGAQYNLGIAYHKGYGVIKDNTIAYAWLNIAAAQGDKNFIAVRDEMKEKLAAEQINEGQLISSEWYAKQEKLKTNDRTGVGSGLEISDKINLTLLKNQPESDQQIKPEKITNKKADKTYPIDAYRYSCIKKDSTTYGMRMCTADAHTMWDKDLNITYKTLMKEMSVTDQQLLQNAQRQWLSYRDSEFKLIDYVMSQKEGTMWTVVHNEETLALSRERSIQLQDYLSGIADIQSESHSIDLYFEKCFSGEESLADKKKCIDISYHMWDEELNRSYKKLMSIMNTEDQQILIDAQRQWLLFRDNESKLIDGSYVSGGSFDSDRRQIRKINILRTRVLGLQRHQFLIEEM